MVVLDLLKEKGGTLYTIGPDATLREAVAVMVEYDIGSIIVMDKGHMSGIITLREVLRALHKFEARAPQVATREIMNARSPKAGPEDSIDYLRGVMTEHHITHVPIFDGDTLLGVLSFHDIARSALKQTFFENELLKKYIKNWPE